MMMILFVFYFIYYVEQGLIIYFLGIISLTMHESVLGSPKSMIINSDGGPLIK